MTTLFADARPDWELPAFTVDEFLPRLTRFAIGIPVINENGRIHSQLDRMKSLRLDEVADIVVADGGSTDGSTADALLAANGVRALLVKRGPGRLSAQLRMFFAYAVTQGYEGAIIIDGNNKD